MTNLAIDTAEGGLQLEPLHGQQSLSGQQAGLELGLHVGLHLCRDVGLSLNETGCLRIFQQVLKLLHLAHLLLELVARAMVDTNSLDNVLKCSLMGMPPSMVVFFKMKRNTQGHDISHSGTFLNSSLLHFPPYVVAFFLMTSTISSGFGVRPNP